jgi:hypothetical protein
LVCGFGLWIWFVDLVCGFGLWIWFVDLVCGFGLKLPNAPLDTHPQTSFWILKNQLLSTT